MQPLVSESERKNGIHATKKTCNHKKKKIITKKIQFSTCKSSLKESFVIPKAILQSGINL